MDRTLVTAFYQAFPSRTVEDIECPPESEHPGNQTVHVTFADGNDAYLKLLTDGNVRRLERAGGVLQYVATQADIRVPRVLSMRAQSEPYPLATSAIQGEPIARRWPNASTPQRESIVDRVGQAIARLHAVQFEQSGRIIGGNAEELRLEEAPWVDVLCNTIDEWAAIVNTTRFEDFPTRVKRILKEHKEVLSDVSATLLHGDPNRKNC